MYENSLTLTLSSENFTVQKTRDNTIDKVCVKCMYVCMFLCLVSHLSQKNRRCSLLHDSRIELNMYYFNIFFFSMYRRRVKKKWPYDFAICISLQYKPHRVICVSAFYTADNYVSVCVFINTNGFEIFYS